MVLPGSSWTVAWIGSRFERGEHDLGAALLQDLARAEQLPFLEAVGGDDQNSRIGDRGIGILHWHLRNSPARRSLMRVDGPSEA